MVSRIRTWTAVVVAVVVSVAAVGPASARVAAPRAAVNLQIVPRGQGTIRGGAEVGGLLCTTNSGEETCGWSAPAGTRVTLTALPVGGAAVKWSVPDCAAGATTCTFTLDEDTTVVAILIGVS